MKYEKTSPCSSCPYRTDTKKSHWSVKEFQDLIRNDKDHFGTVYACHKKDESVCRGFLMNQDKRGFPSIALRISLLRNSVTRKYLDSLHCYTPLFGSIEEMSKANFPEIEL